ncbi:general secretion pathway protein GspK [Rhodanobacter terrae]|uniref:General secretion pathway protein GspK n=1 Tax=Rhodanobacter terrae TaxID=418647 RepID=A0ABW0SUG4_9GAMM
MRRRSLPPPSDQRGVALLLVLWACTLLAILLGGYAALARTEGLQARYLFAQTQAHYAAEAGLMRAVYGLQDPVAKQRWIGDGRTYSFPYDNAKVTLSAIDESGKVDLNTATPEVLQALFRATGMKPAEAQVLADRVVDWHSPTGLGGEADTSRAAYVAAGRDYGPRHGPFASIEELQMVLGITPALYRQLAPVITIWSGTASPNPNTAPPLALAAIPGMTPEQMAAILAARARQATDPSLVLGNGTTHSIRSEATLADGTRAVLRATIRFTGQGGAQPYAVLRWQEGETE